MTTLYSLPAGVTSVSTDGILFEANPDGVIDVTGAHPNTVAALVEHAGCRPVPTPEEIAAAYAAEVERVRFEAEVAAMRNGTALADAAAAAALVDAANAAAAQEAAAAEAAVAERAMIDAAVSAEPIEPVTPPAAAATGAPVSTSSRNVMPPKTSKKGG